MAQIKWSQLPIAQDVSETAYAPIIDLSQPVGGQNQIIPLSLLLSNNVISVTLNGTRVTTLDPNYFTFDEAGVTLQNLPSGGSDVTVNDEPVSALDPNYFAINDGITTLQNLPTVTIQGGTITTLDPNYFVNVDQGQASLQNLPTQVSVNGDPVSTLDPTYFTIGEGGLTLQNIPTGAVVNINMQQVNQLDPNQFGLIEGNGTASLTFSNLSDVGDLSNDTVVLISNNSSVYSTTIGAIASYIGVVSATPTITLPSVPDQIYQGADLNVTGTLTNYGNAPNLLVWIDGAFVGSIGYLPFFGASLGTINSSTSFTVDVPASDFGSIGSHTIFITDWIGTISNTQTYNVNSQIATAATISGSANSPVHGQPLTGFSVSLTPDPSSAYAVLAYNTGQELLEDGARQLFSSGSGLPTLTPSQINSSYQLWIVTTPDTNTGAFLAQSSPFAVT